MLIHALADWSCFLPIRRLRMEYECRWNGVGHLERADGIVAFALVVDLEEHHLLLIVGEGTDAGEDSCLIEHLGRDFWERSGLGRGRGNLSLCGERVQNAREQWRRNTCAAAGGKKSSTIDCHGR